MAKALRTAAIVVGAAALVASGVGVAIGAAAAATTTIAGVSLATLATATSVASAALMVASTAATPKGTVGGNATKYKIDKDSGIPIAFGRTYVGGNVLHRQYYDDPGSRMRNQRESWVTALSLGPVKSIGPLLVDKKPVSFNASGAAIGDFAGNMWLDTQIGQCPEPRALRGPTGDFPGWNASSKLSGLAADLWTLDYDSKGKKFPTGLPQRGRIVEGVSGYDPRLDSTYPGGVGACRIDQPATHVYTQNPWLLGLTFAYGFYQNGHLVAGGGLPITGIDVNAFVQAANTADTNGWVAGGVVYTTSDDDWDILKMLAQAGGGEVFAVGGILSCSHAAPRVSIGTIASADIIGDIVAPSTASMRVRRNTIIPRVRLEVQGWEVVPIKAVTVPEYAIIDRAPRPKETEYPLIQSTKQAAEIAMYEMLDARELDPIVLPCKLPAIGYRPGDCVTLEIPEANLVSRDVVLRERELDFGTFGVTFSARSETASKHAYALGTSTTPPPTPDLSVPGLDLDPPVGWAAAATMIPGGPGSVPMPAIIVSGRVDNPGAEAVLFDYRPIGSSAWLAAGSDNVDAVRKEITAVVGEATYEVGVRYQVRGVPGERLVLGPVTVPKQIVAYEDGTPIEDRKPAEPGADVTGNNTAKDTHAVGGRSAPVLLEAIDKIEPIASTYPDLVEQVGAIEQVQVGTDEALAALGRATVDHGAALAQAERDAGRIGETLLRLLAESDRTREILRDAGIIIDPATGIARIYAVDQLTDRTARAEIALDAAKASITQKASVTYVQEQIALAVLDPEQAAQLEPIILRLTSAETTIDGLGAAITSKAEAEAVTALGGTVSTAIEAIDALAGSITNKVERTDFDRLGVRVASAEQTLSALDGVSSYGVTLRQARGVADDAAEAGLRALLAGDDAHRWQITQQAEARTELFAKVADASSAETAARQLLSVQIGAVDARSLQESIARIAEGKALSKRIDAQSVTSDEQAAAIGTLSEASIAAGKGIAGVTTTIRQQAADDDTTAEGLLRALIAGDETGRARATQLVQVQTEFTTTLIANEAASAIARQSLLVRMQAAEAAIVTTSRALAELSQSLVERITSAETVIRDPNTGLAATRAQLAEVDRLQSEVGKANARAIETLDAQVNDPATGLPEAMAQVASVRDASVERDSALGRRIDTTSADLGDTNSAVSELAEAVVDGDKANARLIEQVTAKLGDLGEATVQDLIEAVVSKTGEILARRTVTVDVNGNLVGWSLIGSAEGAGSLNLINTDLRMGSGKVVFDNGSVMRAQGTGFGKNADLITWFGPSMPIAACTRANAISYEATNGDAYFGGTLTAGTIKNAVQTTTPLANVLTTGPVGSNGGTRTIVLTFIYVRQGASNSAGAGSGGASAQIELRKNGARIGTLDAGGAYSTQQNPEANGPNNRFLYEEQVGGSITVTDNSGGTTVEYSAHVVARTLGPGPAGSGIAYDDISGSISIIQTEE